MTNHTTTAALLTDITYKPDMDELAKWLHISKDEHLVELRALALAAQNIARPKAMFRLAFIRERTEDTVTAGDSTFTSRVMAVNLRDINRVFAYSATAGTEIEAWGRSVKDILHRFWADMIQEQALHAAIQALRDHVADQYRTQKLSTMNPGSLEDWPLQQQRPLFDLLGNTKEAIGVQLLDSFLMAPTKSVSGILFEAEKDYFNCQLCPRVDCPNRRAPYDRDLYPEKYARE